MVFAWTFLVSGLLSMNPGRIFTSPAPGADEADTWKGGALSAPDADPVEALLAEHPDIRELEWDRQAGTPLLRVRTGDGELTHDPAGDPLHFDEDALVTRADALLPDAAIASRERLEAYDAYYYARRGDRPLPVLRIRFDDPGATALYIDPERGTIEARVDRSGRWRRWLYNGLHSLDMAFLRERRPLWDGVMLSLNLAGLAFCLTGVVLAWRRVTGSVRPSRRRRSAG